jgi:hypothetical protein
MLPSPNAAHSSAQNAEQPSRQTERGPPDLGRCPPGPFRAPREQGGVRLVSSQCAAGR